MENPPSRLASIFQDHFSAVAPGYSRYRPGYPDALFAFLAAASSRHGLAVDCGTGSGQAAVGLARHFDRVLGVDASASQLAHAARLDRISYCQCAAERLPLGPASADLVTVAQALHWLDIGAFMAEAVRVLRPGGVLAAWTYGAVVLPTAGMQRIVDRLHYEQLGAWWPPQRELVETGYRTIDFPLEEIRPPALEIRTRVSLEALAGYLRSWSAAERHRAATGVDLVSSAVSELAPLWGGITRELRWPVSMRAGRVT